jgi:hypothetical protein
MNRARSHRRIFGLLSLGLIGLVAELAGRSLTHRLDVGRQVGRVSYAHAEYYPFLLAAVKIGVALMLAGIAWRFAKARAASRAAHRVAVALGASPKRRAPRVRIELSPRLWLISFVGTASIYLIQADAESAGEVGRWTVLSPWLHSSALPVFAVLAVLVAVVFRAVAAWLSDYESLAAEAVAYARRLTAPGLPPVPLLRNSDSRAPRSRFGLSFESRPPPLPA